MFGGVRISEEPIALARRLHRALWVRGRVVPQVGLDARGADPVALVAAAVREVVRLPPETEGVEASLRAALEVLWARRRRMRRERVRAQWVDAVNTQGFGVLGPSDAPPVCTAQRLLVAMGELDAKARCVLLLAAEGRADYRAAAWLGMSEGSLRSVREDTLAAVSAHLEWSSDETGRVLGYWCDPRRSVERSDAALRPMRWWRRMTGAALWTEDSARLGACLARDLMRLAVLPVELSQSQSEAAVARGCARWYRPVRVSELSLRRR